jgi:hypothetical protein
MPELSNSLLDNCFSPLALTDWELCKRCLHNWLGITSLPGIEQIERELAGNDTLTEDDTQ